MLYILIAIIVIASIILKFASKNYCGVMSNMKFSSFIIVIIIVIIVTSATILSLASNSFIFYDSTISEENFVISNFEENQVLSDKAKKQDSQNTIYTYRVSNSNKTISLSDRNVHSISVTKNKEVNHLTIKHNTYFDYLTLRTSNEDDYVFSHK